MSKYIDLFYFLLAFFIGLVYNLLIKPDKKVIIKYPTIYNANKLIYKDDADICYKYLLNETTCPMNKEEIYNVPIQTL